MNSPPGSPGGNNIQVPPQIDHSNGGLNLMDALDAAAKYEKNAPQPGGRRKRRRKSRRKSKRKKKKRKIKSRRKRKSLRKRGGRRKSRR